MPSDDGSATPGSFGGTAPGPIRSRLGPAMVVALVLMAVLSDWRALQTMVARRFHAGDVRAVEYERRYDEMRPFLPRRGVVGYLSDRMDAGAEYYLTQYTLAPLVVARTPGHVVVVGNFFEPRAGPVLARQHGLVIVRDFGQGLLLLRRAPE